MSDVCFKLKSSFELRPFLTIDVPVLIIDLEESFSWKIRLSVYLPLWQMLQGPQINNMPDKSHVIIIIINILGQIIQFFNYYLALYINVEIID